MLIAHVGALCGLWYSPRGINWLLSLNILLASAVLIYAATRMRYIVASKDWPYMGLILFEFGIMTVAICALRESRPAVICSYVGFALHSLASVGAVVFAFTFKINRLM